MGRLRKLFLSLGCGFSLLALGACGDAKVGGGGAKLQSARATVGAATVGLLAIITAMTMLAVFRDRFQGRVAEILAFFRRAIRA